MNHFDFTQYKQKGIAQVYLLIILLIAGGLAGAYFLGKSANAPQPQPVIQLTPTITTTPTQSADETANWKTYTNTKYGFEIKYPDYIKLEFPVNANGVKADLPTIFNNNHPNSAGMMFFVETEHLPYPQTNIPLENGKDVSINGINARQGTMFGGDGQLLVTYFPHSNYTISVEFYNTNGNDNFTQENKEIYIKILPTFKFTN